MPFFIHFLSHYIAVLFVLEVHQSQNSPLNKTSNVRINITLKHVPANIHSCSGKAINITYSECVFVALKSKAQTPYYIVICGLPGTTIFFHFIS